MKRSTWKNALTLNTIKKNDTIIKIWSREKSIPECMIGSSIYIHNGNNYKKLTITREHIGFKCGEFAFTRIKGQPKKKHEKK